MKATMKNLNDHIREAFPGLDIEFVKGKGYFYFAGEDGHNCESIMVYALNHQPFEKWVADINFHILNREIPEPYEMPKVIKL